jgi:transcriptional regulator with GAF, ATPase, and Fis domain
MLREKVREQSFDNIIGVCPKIVESLELVKQVAPTDSTVLIQGETGTGKELYAQAIHKTSKRSDKPLVTLNCASLPAELVESELFGHVKGAFTGASKTREGRFDLADNGTLFLDEIGELQLPLQAKLLRVLQEGEFEPVGSSRTKTVNVRVIAATNRDLKEQVQVRKFREDLYYRLHVFPVHIPPLRERERDVILLAQAFMDKYSKRTGQASYKMTEADHQCLLKYDWPGNVRELQNIIERAMIIKKGNRINLSPLLPSANKSSAMKQDNVDRIYTITEMRQLEKINITKALEFSNWKIYGVGGAAELLKIPPTTLSSKIKKLGIRRRSE